MLKSLAQDDVAYLVEHLNYRQKVERSLALIANALL